jgi:hydrogenase maturation protease
MMKTVIIGIGNFLLGDEGVGVHTIRRLQAVGVPADIELVDGGTLGAELLGYCQHAARMIIVDAVKLDAPPGTIVRFTADELPSGCSTPASAHDGSFTHILSFPGLSIDPRNVVIYGIVPEAITPSLNLSSTVAAALNRLTEMILGQVGVNTGESLRDDICLS